MVRMYVYGGGRIITMVRMYVCGGRIITMVRMYVCGGEDYHYGSYVCVWGEDYHNGSYVCVWGGGLSLWFVCVGGESRNINRYVHFNSTVIPTITYIGRQIEPLKYVSAV